MKKSGVFIFDHSSKSGLSDSEIIYCVKKADVLFCSDMSSSYFSCIIQYFRGKKIVFWGGRLCSESAHKLMKYLGKHVSMEGFALSLTFYRIDIQCSEVNHFLRMFKLNYFNSLEEIIVDSKSLGLLGLQRFIATLSTNTTLNRLGIEIARDEKFMETLGFSLLYLQFNHTLQEIELYAAPINNVCVKSIKAACINGLTKLKHLKFECDRNASVEADALIDICQRREKAGTGVSVIIGYSSFTLQ